MKVITVCIIKKDNKILMVKEAKENFNGNVYVPNDLDEIIL